MLLQRSRFRRSAQRGVLFESIPSPPKRCGPSPDLREGIDSVAPGFGALYFSRVAAQASKTRITRLMSMPIFQQMTARSWRTTTRLLEMLNKG